MLNISSCCGKGGGGGGGGGGGSGSKAEAEVEYFTEMQYFKCNQTTPNGRNVACVGEGGSPIKNVTAFRYANVYIDFTYHFSGLPFFSFDTPLSLLKKHPRNTAAIW